jgi:hypothetical protein
VLASSKRLPSFVALGIAIVAVPLFAYAKTTAEFDPLKFSTGKFHGCAPTGKGGDPYLNSLKNRDVAPPRTLRYKVPALMSVLPHDLPPQEGDRSKWLPWATKAAAQWEKKGVTVEGYLLTDVVPERREKCNCDLPKAEDHDFHLWLANNSAASGGTSAMVVEVSPRTRAQHPTWTRKSLLQLVRGKAKVRITGWLMWDQEHIEQLRKTRLTLWEVHPIHRVQYLSGKTWVTL